MASYQVALISRPEGWEPNSPDDVPPEAPRPGAVLAEHDELFAAVQEAIAYNREPQRAGDDRWAVVVEPGSVGRRWSAARLCTPVTYKVTVIWRPDGWEPDSPLDVPNCAWRTQSEVLAEAMTYQQAADTVRALNRQNIDQASPTWYVLIAVENEPVSQSVSYDPAGTETTVLTRRLHVVRPEEGGRGNCELCPARSFQCAQANWASLPQTFRDKQVRSLRS
jgi:hypothetical protein